MKTDQPAPKQKMEAALAALIRNRAAGDTANTVDRTGTPIHGLDVFLGQSDAAWKQPCILVLCDKATRAVHGQPWYDCLVMVKVINDIDSANGAQLQSDQLGALADVLVDDTADGESIPRLCKLLNKPTGTDIRPVKAIHTLGFWQETDDGIIAERHWDDALVYHFMMMPVDPE